MRRLPVLLLLTASVLAAAPLAAAPRVEVAITDAVVELTVSDATPGAALARLAAAAGFSVEGADSLPQTPVNLHLKGSLARIIATLTDPASRVASYAPGDPPRLTRLVLLPTGGTVAQTAAAQPPAEDLSPTDPAVGASRLGRETLLTEMRANLGLRLP